MQESKIQQTRPEFFYKYVKASTAESILTNGKLRWSAYKALKNLNDTMDLQVQFRAFEGDIEKAKDLFLEKSWNMYSQREKVPFSSAGEALKYLSLRCPGMKREEFYDEYAKEFDETYEEYPKVIERFNEKLLNECKDCKVLCLCESPINTSMWKYFADDHAGMVMVFGNEPNVDSPYKLAKPVRYSKTMPNLFDEEELSDLLSGSISLSSDEYKIKIMEAFALTKRIKFSNEQEWRIVLWRGRASNDCFEYICFNARELKKVIFGCRMLADKRDELYKIATILYPHVEFYEAGFKTGGFEMEIQRIA